MKKILILLLVIVVAVGAGSLLLDDTYAVERSTTISAAPSDITPFLTDLETWEEWTYWNNENIPTLERELGEVTQGPGASMSWTDADGSGELSITKVQADGGIEYDMLMDYFGEAASSGAIELEPVEGGTRVTWSTEGGLGDNPLWRYMGLFMDRMLGAQLDEGLGALKSAVEGS